MACSPALSRDIATLTTASQPSPHALSGIRDGLVRYASGSRSAPEFTNVKWIIVQKLQM